MPQRDDDSCIASGPASAPDSRPASGPHPTPDLATLAEALVPLAKRGAYAVCDVTAGGTAQILVERRQTIAVASTLPAAAFRAALDAGWIAASEPSGTYRLTARGLAAVRRGISQRQLERAAASPAPTIAPYARAPARNEAESPLAWLRSRRDGNGQPLLGDAQFDAGERLRADLWRAQMTPRVTASWSGIPQSRSERRTAPGATGMADAVVAARRRIEHAFKAVGPEHFDLLFDVCGHLKGLEQVEREAKLPPRSGKRFLERALTALARHYGLLPPLDVDAAIMRRLRHWGSDDYRPTTEQWE